MTSLTLESLAKDGNSANGEKNQKVEREAELEPKPTAAVSTVAAPLPCPHCGALFVPRTRLHKLCSEACWKAINQTKVYKPSGIESLP